NSKVRDSERIMRELRIGSITVVVEEGKLMGMITNGDMRFQKDLSVPIVQIMTCDKFVAAQDGITLDKAGCIEKQYKIEKLPVVSKKGKFIGLITYKDIQKKKNKPNACQDEF